MDKNFDSWNTLKKRIHSKNKPIYCNVREIWWCSLGVNIGSEQDGKNHLYERPVLIQKVFNTSMCRIIPLTGQVKDDQYHLSIQYRGRNGSLIFSQIKTISTYRLSRKMARLDREQFEKVTKRLKETL